MSGGQAPGMRFGLFSVQDYYPDLGVEPRRFFENLLERIRYAEALGFESYWLAEHHFHINYGLNPSPAVLLASAARETSRIRLGPAVAVLTLNHPVKVAEDYALVDILSGGRLNFGVGSGYLHHEFEGWGVPHDEKAQRFDEALEIVLRLFRGERFRHEGRFFRTGEVFLQAPPLQKPHPPVWVAFLHAESAYYRGRQGLQIMGVPYATVPHLRDLKPLIERWREGYAEAGKEPDRAEVVMALHAYVAETDAQAERDARPHLERYLATRLFGKGTWDSLRRNWLALIGSPETVAEGVALLHDTGATTLLCLMDFGGLPHEKVKASMALWMEAVAPRFQPAPASTQTP